MTEKTKKLDRTKELKRRNKRTSSLRNDMRNLQNAVWSPLTSALAQNAEEIHELLKLLIENAGNRFFELFNIGKQ